MTISAETWAREIAATAIVALFFALTGAFGTGSDYGFPARFCYWAVNISVCAASFHVAVHLFLRKGLYTVRERALRVLAGAFAGSFVPAAVIVAMERLVRGSTDSKPWYIWLTVFVIGIVICFVRFMPPRWRVSQIADLRTVEPERVPFLQRLPAELGYDLVSVSVEDHYVMVITTSGSTMIKLPFRTALSELKNYPGLQIHRSHWIATDSLEKVRKIGRGHQALLKDGRQLPISQTFIRKVDLLRSHV